MNMNEIIRTAVRRDLARFESALRTSTPRGRGHPVALASLRATVSAPVRFVLSRLFGRAHHREVAPVWTA